MFYVGTHDNAFIARQSHDCGKTLPRQPQDSDTTNQVLRRAQLYTTAEVEPWTVGASMDKTFKRDTALNLDCDQIFDITWVFLHKTNVKILQIN